MKGAFGSPSLARRLHFGKAIDTKTVIVKAKRKKPEGYVSLAS
jgi:hypothetical protein